ncbi:MAG: glycosyltransferase family 39 protein [Chloroflexi bacterium]|nr:glycosyltransferase family 39 protein [Chloroflexota bacterium]
MNEDSESTQNRGQGETPESNTPSKSDEGTRLWNLRERTLIAILAVLTLVIHGYNMFGYPLYLGDEGIYMEQAWSVLRMGKLSPYTYFYDHAPGGWILISGWTLILPGQFNAAGMAINSGRILMLILQVASVVLLYRVTKKFTGSDIAAVATVGLFTFSPLGLYYQRMVLLDNILVFWMMISLYLVVFHGNRLVTLVASGVAFGLGMLTKENAVFFAPVLAYMIYSEVKQTYYYRFAMAGWLFSAIAITSLYPLYALLKNEFLPSGTLLSNTPAEHVSLITTLIWQLGRSGGSILNPDSQFWVFFMSRWWVKDSIIIVLGIAATTWNILVGVMDRQHHRNELIAGLFSAAFGFYLIKGSAMLEFYVVPILPFFALNVGMVIDQLLKSVLDRRAPTGFLVIFVALSLLLLYGARDQFFIDQTRTQLEQLQFVRDTVPSRANVVIDDDLWVDLHEKKGNRPAYPNANSHWKVAQDPDIRDKLLRGDWRNIDYLVLSTDMYDVLRINNETIILQAYDHSKLMATFQEGNVILEVRRVVK